MKTAALREMNDKFRQTFEDGKVIFTEQVCNLEKAEKLKLLELIKKYDDFNQHNDPYGEHDFGDIMLAGEMYFWKIDYYDKSFLYHSPEPESLENCKRVMIIMHSSEY